MNHKNSKLVTIICEPILSAPLIGLVQSLGAKGFTVTDVRGEGSGHRHSGEVPNEKIKIEVICNTELASKMMTQISKDYFEDYSLITYSTDIFILRPEKF